MNDKVKANYTINALILNSTFYHLLCLLVKAKKKNQMDNSSLSEGKTKQNRVLGEIMKNRKNNFWQNHNNIVWFM